MFCRFISGSFLDFFLFYGVLKSIGVVFIGRYGCITGDIDDKSQEKGGASYLNPLFYMVNVI